jgi:hypothetical protein
MIAESVGLVLCSIAISFPISKIRLRLSEMCAVSFGESVDPDLILLLMSFTCKSLAVAFDPSAP